MKPSALIFEEDAHLGDDGAAGLVLVGGNLDAGEEVFLTVGAKLEDGELGAGDDDGLAEVLEHKTEGGGGEGHGIGAVENDEAVVAVVAVGYHAGQFHPVLGLHIARVDGRVEGGEVDVVLEAAELGHMAAEVRQVEVFEGARLGVFHHADGTAGVDDEDA